MRHIKYDDDYLFPDGVTYIELDDEGWALRRIIKADDHILLSGISDFKDDILPEGTFDIDELGFVVDIISHEEFEAEWDKGLSLHDTIWKISQKAYPTGTVVQGKLLLFYPQGVIVEIDKDTIGLADYEACRISTQPENLYPGHRVIATVKGYINQQHWIVLDKPQVLHDKIE
jgi:hypothetical protein